jgi:nucleotide-binding universal stress UspA family protein
LGNRLRKFTCWSFALDVGPAAEKIVDYANAHEIDLIVVNTHGRTGIRRWVLGSVAAKIVEAAPCPVLLIRAPV